MVSISLQSGEAKTFTSRSIGRCCRRISRSTAYAMTSVSVTHGAFVAVHFEVAAVDAVAGEFAVVNYGPVEDVEWVCSAPPAGCVGWETAVATPQVTLVVVEAEEFCNVFWEADAFEDTHVFAAAEHEGFAAFCVYAHDSFDDVVFFCLA